MIVASSGCYIISKFSTAKVIKCLKWILHSTCYGWVTVPLYQGFGQPMFFKCHCSTCFSIIPVLPAADQVNWLLPAFDWLNTPDPGDQQWVGQLNKQAWHNTQRNMVYQFPLHIDYKELKKFTRYSSYFQARMNKMAVTCAFSINNHSSAIILYEFFLLTTHTKKVLSAVSLWEDMTKLLCSDSRKSICPRQMVTVQIDGTSIMGDPPW